MLTAIHPKLPMRHKQKTREFYLEQMGFQEFGSIDYEGYLMVQQDQIQIHFFEFPALNPLENYGQAYISVQQIEAYYQRLIQRQVAIHPNGQLSLKPWRQWEFSVLDPDHNLLTFGEEAP